MAPKKWKTNSDKKKDNSNTKQQSDKGVSSINGVAVPQEFTSYFTMGVDSDGNPKPRLMIPSNLSFKQKQDLDAFLRDNKLYKQILQGGNDSKKGKDNLFFAGLNPEDYEYKFAVGSWGQDAADQMTPQARRNTYFDFLGLDPKYKDKGSDVYNDPEFKKQYYEKFKAKLPEGQYRSELGDDFKFGFEHYDNIPFAANAQPPKKQDPEKEKEKEQVKKCPDGYWFYNGECVPMDPGLVPEDPGNPGKFFDPDIRAYQRAYADRIFKGYPILPQYNAEPGDVAYEDYATQAANLHSANQQLTDYVENSTTSGQSGVGAVIGATADNLSKITDIIADVQNRNVNRYNDFSRYAAQVENQEKMLNTNARKNYQDEVNKVEQNYSDELDLRDKAIVDAWGNMYKNEQKASILEELFPNARRKSRWDPSTFVGPKSGRYALDDFDTYTAAYGSGSDTDYSDPSYIQTEAKRLMKDEGLGAEDAYDKALNIYKGVNAAKTKKGKSGNAYSYAVKYGGKSPNFGVFLQGGFFD